MADIDLKKLSTLLDEKTKPLHGELARTTTELRTLKLNDLKTEIALHKISQDLARLDSNIETLSEKADCLLTDVNQLQDEMKASWDKITIVAEKNKREIDEVKEHLGL
ncbi:MAG: hypothetical protein Q7S79_00260 [bacterium]|nr:hypothetical protein [bacterium]